MAQIGHGYGSEFQLLRFLGHHRHFLESTIYSTTGFKGPFDWIDFGFADRMKSISGDLENKGLLFLENIIDKETYKSIDEEYKSYKITDLDNWQNWDAIAVVDKTILLVEAKAHKGEIGDKNRHSGKSGKEILRFMQDQLPEIKVTEEWLMTYYQFANRIATTALLEKHLSKIGFHAKALFIYFINGYCKRIEENRRIIEVKGGKKDTSEASFKKEIEKELLELGLSNIPLEKYVAPHIFIDANPSE